MTAVNRVKAKLVQLYSARISRGTMGMHTPEALQEKRMCLFHLIRSRKRRDQRTITTVHYSTHGTQTSTRETVNDFSSCLR
jgi:hypothetical protein